MSKKNQGDYHSYNHSKSIGQQIKLVNEKIGEVEMEDQENFQDYFYKVYMSLAALDATMEPFKDDEYPERLTSEEPLARDASGKLKFIHNTLKDIMNLCDRENLFYTKRTGRRKT